MPIKGLTDGGDRFPVIGDVRKGAPKTEANKPGKDLTYFRYVPVEGEASAAEAFDGAYLARVPEGVRAMCLAHRDLFDAYYHLARASRNLKRWLVLGLVALVVPGGLALAGILWWRRRNTSKGIA